MNKTSVFITWFFRTTLIVALIAISYLAFTPTIYPLVVDHSDKINHAFAFFVLAFLIDFSFPSTEFNLNKFLILLFYGVMIEGVQYNLPYRDFSLLDLGANLLGMLIYWFSLPVIRLMPILNLRWED